MKATTAGIALMLAGSLTACGGGDDNPADQPSTPGPSTTTTTTTTTTATALGTAIGAPTDWLTTVCPDGAFSNMEVFTEGRAGPDALNEGFYCTSVPQDGAVAYHSVELFTYAADPTPYWTEQAADPASCVYVAIAQTEAGWAVFLEDDSRHEIADPLVAAASEVGFTTYLDG